MIFGDPVLRLMVSAEDPFEDDMLTEHKDQQTIGFNEKIEMAMVEDMNRVMAAMGALLLTEFV